MMSVRTNVILDTNFFVDMFRFKISFDDIENVVEDKCNFWIMKQSINELEKMQIKEAKIALVLIKDTLSKEREYKRKIGILKIGGKHKTVDDAIISLFSQLKKETVLDMCFEDTVVGTNDAKLRKKIKTLGTRVIYLRARKRLEIH